MVITSLLSCIAAAPVAHITSGLALAACFNATPCQLLDQHAANQAAKVGHSFASLGPADGYLQRQAGTGVRVQQRLMVPACLLSTCQRVCA